MCRVNTRLPYFYGLPKIHKEQVPLRPIVSTIGSPTYALAKHLATILSPIVGQTPSHIRNSKHFVELMKDQRISDSDIMISFDVSSLFTNVPILETLDYLKEKLEEDSTLEDRTNLSVDSVLHLTQLCVQTTYFSYGDSIFQQKQGAAMGSPLSPIWPIYTWNILKKLR